MPGIDGDLIGRDAYTESQSQAVDLLGGASVRIDDLLPRGDGRVIVVSHLELQGGLSQQMLELHEWGGGELVRQTVWFDREEGRRELGL